MQVGLTLAGTLLMNVLLAAYIYGQLTQKVKDLTSWSKEHNEQLRDHSKQLLEHEGRISHIEGRKGLPHNG